MNDRHCPDASRLIAFCQGNLMLGEIDAVSLHLEECANCRDRVAQMDSSADLLVGVLRLPADSPYDLNDTELSLLCARVTQQLDVTIASESSVKVANEPPRLQKYQTRGLIGRGGMGAVYAAVHSELDKPVAIKVLPASRLVQPESVERFRREMRAVGRLDHPNIVRAMDAGVEGQTHYLAMEMVHGLDVSDVIKRCGTLAIADACEIIRQAALALDYASGHEFVHRDVKPSNLMLGVQPTKRVPDEIQNNARTVSPATADWVRDQPSIVKLMDMGLALLGEPQGGELTATGQVMGTVDYMAPEQINDTRGVDIRADIYSLGATLYRLLTGVVPFQHAASGGSLGKLSAIANDDIPRVESKRDDVRNELAVIVHRMLEKNPNSRFQTPAAVASAIEPHCIGSQLSTLLARAWGVDTTVASAASEVTVGHRGLSDTQSSQTDAPLQQPYESKPPRSIWVASAAIAGLLIASILIYRFVTRDGELIVEIDSPTRPVLKVDNQEVQFTWDQSQHLLKLDIDPGNRSIELTTQEGVRFKADVDLNKLQIQAGETTKISAWLVPADSPPGAESLASKKAADVSLIVNVSPLGDEGTLTLAQALEVAQPGQTIRLAPGTYPEGPDRDQGDWPCYRIDTDRITIVGDESLVASGIVQHAPILTLKRLAFYAVLSEGKERRTKISDCRYSFVRVGESCTCEIENSVGGISGGYLSEVTVRHCTVTSRLTSASGVFGLCGLANFQAFDSVFCGHDSAIDIYRDPPSKLRFEQCLFHSASGLVASYVSGQGLESMQTVPLAEFGQIEGVTLIDCRLNLDPQLTAIDLPNKHLFNRDFRFDSESPAKGILKDGSDPGAIADETGWPLAPQYFPLPEQSQTVVRVSADGAEGTLTLKQALEQLQSGMTLQLGKGLYTEGNAVTESGNMQFRVDQPDVTIVGNQSIIAGRILQAADNLTVKGLNCWDLIQNEGGTYDLNVRNCRMKSLSVLPKDGPDCRIDLRDSVCSFRCGGFPDVTIDHCTLLACQVGTRYRHTEIPGRGRWTVRDSILWGREELLSIVDSPGDLKVEFDHCLLYSANGRFFIREVPSYGIISTPELTTLKDFHGVKLSECVLGKDPLFQDEIDESTVDAADLRLKSDSPAIGAASDGNDLGPRADSAGWPLTRTPMSTEFLPETKVK